MNAEFQGIARRDKKTILSDQCKEIEENNRMGKFRDIFKKIRDTKETFHAEMGKIKDRNDMNQQKQKILRRGGKNTQKVKVKLLSRVRLLATPWTAAHQAPPPMGFFRQEYWSGVPLPSPEEISSLSHSVVFLYFFALITEEGFLISCCYSLELCIQMLISFLFSFIFPFSSFHSYL